MNFISKQFSDTAGVTLVGHSSGGYECAILLSTPWYQFDEKVADYFKTKLKGVVLMCGVFDVTQLIPTVENEIIKLSWYENLSVHLCPCCDNFKVFRQSLPLHRLVHFKDIY